MFLKRVKKIAKLILDKNISGFIKKKLFRHRDQFQAPQAFSPFGHDPLVSIIAVSYNFRNAT